MMKGAEVEITCIEESLVTKAIQLFDALDKDGDGKGDGKLTESEWEGSLVTDDEAKKIAKEIKEKFVAENWGPTNAHEIKKLNSIFRGLWVDAQITK